MTNPYNWDIQNGFVRSRQPWQDDRRMGIEDQPWQDGRRMGIEETPMSGWKSIDKDGNMEVAPKGTPRIVDWKEAAESKVERATAPCTFAVRREVHGSHNWAVVGVPVHCPGFAEDAEEPREIEEQGAQYCGRHQVYHSSSSSCAKYDAATSRTELRDGDQPLPIPNESRDIQSRVVEDIEERRKLGISRYGTALQPHNGRDALRAAYDLALDIAINIRQAIAERDGK